MTAVRHLETMSGNTMNPVLLQFGTGAAAQTTQEWLPFTIKITRDEAQLGKAVAVRRAAYARHVPTLAQLLVRPEPCDRDPATVVLLAESKLDGAPLGTVRIQTNRSGPLAIEQSVQLPASLREASLAEPTRLGIVEGRIGRVVKTMLFKALYQYCRDAEIDWIVIGARSPLDRQYQALLFEDVFPGKGFIPLRHAGNIPHRVLAFRMDTAEARWTQANHPLYGLFCRTEHPDIDLRDPRHARPADQGLRAGFGLAAVQA
ncbi:MAG: hypothetical protein M0015_08710 [Betaproteobacteria bacterium]|nr:hypothetical protein [Betaproteobacteria bacterium]